MSPRERIVAALDELGPDELAVIATIVERVAHGRKLYGNLDIATDPRTFERECLEECADGLFYAAASLMRAGKPWGKSEPAPAPTGRQCGAEREG